MNKKQTNWTEIQSLIDRFYEGATTQAEESLLMQVMCSEEVPEAMQTDAEVFRTLAQEEQQGLEIPELSADFEQRVMDQIEAPRLSIARHWWPTAAAACLLAVLMLTPALLDHSMAEPEEFASSDITQDEAEQYAAYALSMVSSKMKMGIEELDVISQVQDQVRLTLNDTFTE